MGSCAAPETSSLKTTRSPRLVTRSCPTGLGPALAGTGGSASRVRLRLARELLILKKRFREGSRLDRPARGRLRSPSVAISQARYCSSLRRFHKPEIARQSHTRFILFSSIYRNRSFLDRTDQLFQF